MDLTIEGLLWWLSDKESACQCRRREVDLWIRKIHWRRKWQPTPVFLSAEFHGQRSLAGYSPWGHKRARHDWATKQYPFGGHHESAHFVTMTSIANQSQSSFLLSLDLASGSFSTLLSISYYQAIRADPNSKSSQISARSLLFPFSRFFFFFFAVAHF